MTSEYHQRSALATKLDPLLSAISDCLSLYDHTNTTSLKESEIKEKESTIISPITSSTMLGLESSFPYLQDEGPCAILPPLTDDVLLCDGDMSPDIGQDLSLAVELIEAEERNTRATSPQEPLTPSSDMDLQINDLVDIISQSCKQFPLSHDIPDSDTLLDTQNILDDQGILGDITDDDMLSDSTYSSPSTPEMTTVIPPVKCIVKQTITRPVVPEEERPSKKYPHILSTLQGTYKGLPANRPSAAVHTQTSGPAHAYKQGGGHAQYVSMNLSQVQRVLPTYAPASRMVPAHMSTAVTHMTKVPVKFTAAPVSAHTKFPTAVLPGSQPTRIVSVQQPVRLISPNTLHQPVATTVYTTIPQASVPKLPPPIAKVPNQVIKISQPNPLTLGNGSPATLHTPVFTAPTAHSKPPIKVNPPTPVTKTSSPIIKASSPVEPVRKPQPKPVQKLVVTDTPDEEDGCYPQVPKTVNSKLVAKEPPPHLVRKEAAAHHNRDSESSDIEADAGRRGKKRTVTSAKAAAAQKGLMKRGEHFQDLKVEIQDWECANTKLRYEIFQLEKQLKAMSGQLQNHDCKLETTDTTTATHVPDVSGVTADNAAAAAAAAAADDDDDDVMSEEMRSDESASSEDSSESCEQLCLAEVQRQEKLVSSVEINKEEGAKDLQQKQEHRPLKVQQTNIKSTATKPAKRCRKEKRKLQQDLLAVEATENVPEATALSEEENCGGGAQRRSKRKRRANSKFL